MKIIFLLTKSVELKGILIRRMEHLLKKMKTILKYDTLNDKTHTHTKFTSTLAYSQSHIEMALQSAYSYISSKTAKCHKTLILIS